MEKKIILPVLCSLILILGVPQAFAQSSTTPPPDFFTAEISPPETCVGGETDLLIQDITDFWNTNTVDPRGAFVSELISQAKNWCSIDSSAIGTTDLSGFRVIILASNQDSGFYTNVFPGGFVHTDLATWVFNGGIMSASLGTCINYYITISTWTSQTICNKRVSRSYNRKIICEILYCF